MSDFRIGIASSLPSATLMRTAGLMYITQVQPINAYPFEAAGAPPLPSAVCEQLAFTARTKSQPVDRLVGKPV